MKPIDYLESLNESIATNPVVTSYQITRQRTSKVDAYIRIIITLIDDSRLEMMEYIRSESEGESVIERYSYHWMDAGNSLITRWDNAEHYPNLPDFPHHLHDGDEKNVLPGESMSLQKVLDAISNRLNE